MPGNNAKYIFHWREIENLNDGGRVACSRIGREEGTRINTLEEEIQSTMA